MIIEHMIEGNQLTIKPEGRLDSSTAGELDDKISEVLTEEISSMKIDMSDVDFISSKGIRVLVSAYRKTGEKEMILTGANSSVQEVLKLSGLYRVFTINPEG